MPICQMGRWRHGRKISLIVVEPEQASGQTVNLLWIVDIASGRCRNVIREYVVDIRHAQWTSMVHVVNLDRRTATRHCGEPMHVRQSGKLNKYVDAVGSNLVEKCRVAKF